MSSKLSPNINQAQRHAHWRQVVTEFNNSGLTPTQFCKQNGIPISSLYAWRKKVSCLPKEEDREKKEDLGFIPLSVNGHTRLKKEETLEVQFPSGAKLILNVGIDSPLLSQLIKALGNNDVV